MFLVGWNALGGMRCSWWDGMHLVGCGMECAQWDET